LTGLSDIPFYGSSDDLDWYRSSSFRQQWPAISDAHTRVLLRLSESGVGRLAYAPALYLGAGLIASALLVRIDRQRELWAMVFTMQVLLQLGLYFTAPVVRFRYQYFQVVLGLTLVILAIQLWRRNTRAGRAGDQANAGRSPVGAIGS
jgi:hypothetical protein